MIGSLYSGISGIKTHQFGIDSTSNNIANVNTVGYRANLPEFKNLFALQMDYINSNSPISNNYNHGATISSNAINANDGSYVKADGQFNVAISGRSWFVVGTNPNGNFDVNNPLVNQNNNQQNYFTRDGSFSLDGNGYLVNSSGYYMYGVNLGKISPDGILTSTKDLTQDYANLSSSVLQPIQIPKNLQYSPTLTTDVNLSINLNRTEGLKGIDKITDEEGKFDLEKFYAQDINAFMNESGKALDPKNSKDINFSLEFNGVVKNYSFVYGDDFRTFGELRDLIKEEVGLDMNLKLDSNGNPLDCSFAITSGTMQNFKISISGKLADKLDLKQMGKEFKSPLDGKIAEFDDKNLNYKEGELVKQNGMIFKRVGNDPLQPPQPPAPQPGQPAPQPNLLEDDANWELVDSSGVAFYDHKKTDYAIGNIMIYDGKIYKRIADVDTMIPDPDNKDPNVQKEIKAMPDENEAWEEVTESVVGQIPEFEAGTKYKEGDIIAFNGNIYQNTKDDNEAEPGTLGGGWTVVTGDSLNSTRLQVSTYETNTEIYDNAGAKFILKNEFVLLEQGDYTANPPVNERWEVKTSIYDMDGKVMLNDAPMVNELTFNADGSVNGEVFEIPFKDGSISVDLTQSEDGKMTSNFAYANSEIKSVKQDGVPQGILKDFLINEDGIIMANFSNGKMEPIGRFGLAAFVNDQGLSSVGGNMFKMNVRTINGETNIVSGAPTLAWEENGLAKLKYAKVLDGMLETSNVDTGSALTDLIVYQRGYQMSAKSISTADQLMQEAIQLKR